MKYVIYTTTSSPWYQDRADEVAKRLSESKGRNNVQIDVLHIAPFRNPPLIVDNDGDSRFAWDWLATRLYKGGYNGVGFHFTPYYRRKWDISDHINGSRNALNQVYPQFWLCCGKEEADGYTHLTEFERLLLHEIAHFDEDLDDANGNLLSQESVHIFDYQKKAIHLYPRFVDYRGYNLKQSIDRLVSNVIKLAYAIIRKTPSLSSRRNQ